MYMFSFSVNEAEFEVKLETKDSEKAKKKLFANLKAVGARFASSDILLLSCDEYKEVK